MRPQPVRWIAALGPQPPAINTWGPRCRSSVSLRKAKTCAFLRVTFMGRSELSFAARRAAFMASLCKDRAFRSSGPAPSITAAIRKSAWTRVAPSYVLHKPLLVSTQDHPKHSLLLTCRRVKQGRHMCSMTHVQSTLRFGWHTKLWVAGS